ncbi:MAG: alpha/beta fold hydrolase [Cyanobacteriota/Melainabacteria group bacterium]|nr:alpha/beta fold hydrolase [Cyanobacteria bacterium HKST-UBA01]
MSIGKLARKQALIALALTILVGAVPQESLAAKGGDRNQPVRAYQVMLSDDEGAEGSKALSEHRPYNRGKIPCLIWQARKPKAAMLAIHGFGLHKGTYEQFAREMAKVGISVYAIDVRGFGHWVQKGVNRIDFDGTLYDIGLALNEIHKTNKDIPVVVIGESMGGGIALAAAAQYPTLVDGLITSVPAGDRFDKADSSIDVVKQFLFRGANTPMDVGHSVVSAATKDEKLRKAWLGDPLCRTEVTPNELIAFNNFMNKTLKVATHVDKMPVLFIQGSKDKLVRPAGTMKLFNRISSPHKQFVLSTTAEHLIFEKGQFSKQDLSFIESWLDGTVADILPNKIAQTKTEPAKIKPKDKPKPVVTKKASFEDIKAKKRSSLSYWIELKRDGKVFRCNNKMTFKSGDAIRFHLVPDSDGYAYIVLKQGTTGNSAVLFPSAATGNNNYLRKGQDFPLPYQDWLAFDDNPGLEKVRIMFSRNKVDIAKMQEMEKRKVAYVSPDTSGAKDLVGTGLQLSWDDPNPVIMPDEIEEATKASSSASQVKLVFDNIDGTLAVDVALQHK